MAGLSGILASVTRLKLNFQTDTFGKTNSATILILDRRIKFSLWLIK